MQQSKVSDIVGDALLLSKIVFIMIYRTSWEISIVKWGRPYVIFVDTSQRGLKKAAESELDAVDEVLVAPANQLGGADESSADTDK